MSWILPNTNCHWLFIKLIVPMAVARIFSVGGGGGGKVNKKKKRGGKKMRIKEEED